MSKFLPMVSAAPRRGESTNSARGRAPRPARVLIPLAVLSSLAGCPEVTNPYRPFLEPDYEQFVNTVQPIVQRHCAFNACHGTPDRTLSLYAVGFQRAGPELPGTPLSESQLTDQELVWNYDALRIRLFEGDKLLLKCLDPAVGGIRHASGFVVYASRSDPDYVALSQWIESAR